MDYNNFHSNNNPSSCGSSSGTGENRKEKMKKISNGNGNGNGNGSSNGKRNKGVMKLSTDPQSVAARERRHRISDRFKILQSLVPGGTKMDTVSMLDEAIHYVKFLKTQIWLHQTMINFVDYDDPVASATATASSSLPFDHHNNNISNIFYPTTNDDVNVVDGVKMEEPFLPQFEPNYFPAGDEQFMCSYDTYMNF